jgi:isocitrate/isopropylmalate dehydrogenase
LDWVLIRENSEGEYAGHGGTSHEGYAHEVSTEVAIFTRTAIQRIMRFAFATAQSRARKHLCVVTKSNAQRNGLVLWDKIAKEVSQDYPDVTYERVLVDAMTVRMTLHPSSIDTVVATNLHADILSDLAAALAGSIGIAPTANLDPSRERPSMFEPIHGTAFDLIGKDKANPIGAFWSACMMLEWLGEVEESQRLMRAIEKLCGNNVTTSDLGGKQGTKAVTAALISALEQG